MDFTFIKTIRKNKDLSIKELALLTQISSHRLSDIENNKPVNPTLKEVESILKILDYKLVVKDSINHYSSKEFDFIN